METILRKPQLLLIALLSASFLVACGGEAQNTPLPPERPTSVVKGQAVDARIKNATVEIFPFNNFDPNALLASTTTDDMGFYSINLAAASQPVSVRLSGGSYNEESSGVEVSLKQGQVLYAATYYESPKPITIMVTPLTNMSHALAVWKMKQGTPLFNAISESVSAITSIYGVDTLATFPINITDPLGQGIVLPLDDRARYGFVAAGLSALSYSANPSNPHTNLYTSIELAQIMYSDVLGDGLLDGHAIVNGFYTQLQFGNILLDANFYRSVMSYRILETAAAAYNNTGITVQQLLPWVTSLAASTHDVFSNYPTAPIDIDPPTFSTNQSPGSWYAGIMNFHLLVSDFVGVASVDIDVDGFALPPVEGDLTDINYPIDTIDLGLAYGPHQIGVSATDLLGNSDYKQFLVNVNNDGPSVNITSSSYTNNPNFLITGTYDDLGIGMESILINDIAAGVNTDKTLSAQVPLTLGQNNLHIVATDKLGNVFIDDVILNYDLKLPKLQTSHSSANFVQSNGTIFQDKLFDTNETWPIYLTTDKLSLKGTPITPSNLNSAGIPYFGLLFSDPIETGAETKPEDLKIEYNYTRGATVMFDWVDASQLKGMPNLVQPVYIPLVNEVLGDNWYLAPSPDTIYTIGCRATDLAGNTFTIYLTFMLEVSLPPQNVTSADGIDLFAANGFNFGSRTSAFTKTFDAVSYTYPNNNDFPILVKLVDNSTHTLTNNYETAIRENQAHLVTQEQWQGDFAYLGDKWLSTGVIPVTSIQLVNGNFNFNNASLLDMFNLYNANPDPAGSGPLGTPVLTTITVPASTNGAVEIMDTDTPVAPNPTPWSSYSPAATNYYRHQFYPNTTLWPGSIDDTLNYMLPDPIAYTNQYGQQAAFAYAHIQHSSSALASSSYTHSNTLQKRTYYYYESEPGFPKNTVTTGSTYKTFSTTSFKVVDSIGQSIPQVLGFYRIPANSEGTIIKSVTLPTVISYNDTEVGDLTTFGSYTEKKFDKAFETAIDTSIEVDAYIDIGYQDSGALKPRVNVYEGAPFIASLSR